MKMIHRRVKSRSYNSRKCTRMTISKTNDLSIMELGLNRAKDSYPPLSARGKLYFGEQRSKRYLLMICESYLLQKHRRTIAKRNAFLRVLRRRKEKTVRKSITQFHGNTAKAISKISQMVKLKGFLPSIKTPTQKKPAPLFSPSSPNHRRFSKLLTSKLLQISESSISSAPESPASHLQLAVSNVQCGSPGLRRGGAGETGGPSRGGCRSPSKPKQRSWLLSRSPTPLRQPKKSFFLAKNNKKELRVAMYVPKGYRPYFDTRNRNRGLIKSFGVC